MISKQEIQHIAKLARLGLTKKEISKYQKELSAILDYVAKLKEIDAETSQLLPVSHSLEIEHMTRGDETQKSKINLQKLMELMPETKDDFLKVKSILK